MQFQLIFFFQSWSVRCYVWELFQATFIKDVREKSGFLQFFFSRLNIWKHFISMKNGIEHIFLDLYYFGMWVSVSILHTSDWKPFHFDCFKSNFWLNLKSLIRSSCYKVFYQKFFQSSLIQLQNCLTILSCWQNFPEPNNLIKIWLIWA